jgi:hypothetical protein
MLDDLTKEIKAQLYERVKSPLFGAFALSWVAWNYRALLAVLSKMSVQETVAYIDGLYPSAWEKLGYCFCGPLFTAVLFLLAYPYPARWMYGYWATQHKKLKKVQQDIEDETPLTQEEAKALRKTSLEQVSALEAQILEQRQLNNELNERLRAAAEEASTLTKERNQFSEAAKKNQEELSQHLAEVLHKNSPFSTQGALAAVAKAQDGASKALEEKMNAPSSPFQYQPVGHPLPKSVVEMMEASGQEIAIGDNLSVFRVLCDLESATTEEIAAVLGRTIPATHQSLMNLVGEGWVVRNGRVWGLTEKGSIAKATGLGP